MAKTDVMLSLSKYDNNRDSNPSSFDKLRRLRVTIFKAYQGIEVIIRRDLTGGNL
jgi:hypothetical protein